MVHHTNKPLTVNEAKQALRLATQKLEPQGFIKDHPASLLGLAFIGGIVLGNKKSRRVVLQLMESLFINYLSRMPQESTDNSQL